MYYLEAIVRSYAMFICRAKDISSNESKLTLFTYLGNL